VLAVWSVMLVLGVAFLTTVRLPVITVGPWPIDLNLKEGKPPFDVMTDFAMFGAIIFETLAVTTIFVFRWRYPQAVRPYQCPGYPAVPILYLFLPGFILTMMFLNNRAESMAGLGFIVLGACVYAIVFGRRRPSANSIP
jgi:basic amino acid/polyamine antiporter, APA family